MLCCRIAGLTLPLVLSLAPLASAQSSTDNTLQRARGPTRAWLSLGVGGGNSNHGGIAGRAAASVAVSRLLVFTVEGTSVGSIEGSDDSIDLVAGVRTPDPNGFLFFSAGLANTSCGSGCPNQTGIAVDGGYHIGGRYAGVSLTGFAIRAPGHSNSSGVVLSLDVGWFGRQRVPSKTSE
jgi:hypothetical protein